MKKLILICEGYTERMFCKNILKDHFLQFNIDIEFPLISYSNGGIVKWVHLKPQIEGCFQTDANSFVTTLIDYYGIESHHDFPKWADSLLEPDGARKMSVLEKGMRDDLSIAMQAKFIPYIQLHEFEALVFSDYLAFANYYEPREANLPALQNICAANPNPEDINNSPLTAPSKRLKANIRIYNKVNDGPELLKMIGLQKIRLVCPRFNEWLTKLENI